MTFTTGFYQFSAMTIHASGCYNTIQLISKYLETLDKETKHISKCQRHQNGIESLTDVESQRGNDKKIQTTLLEPELPEIQVNSA